MNDVQDQNYTIAKFVGEPRVYGDKTRFAFTTNEEGSEKVLSLFTKFPEGLKEGAQIWGHIEEQEKDGKTYHNFFFGKNNPNKKGSMSDADRTSIALAVRQSSDALTAVRALEGRLINAGVLEETTSNGDPMPNFDSETESLNRSAEAAMA